MPRGVTTTSQRLSEVRAHREVAIRALLEADRPLLNKLRIREGISAIPLRDDELSKLCERIARTDNIPRWLMDPKLLSKLLEVVNAE